MTLESSADHRNRVPTTAILITGLISVGLAAVVAQYVSSRNVPAPAMDLSNQSSNDVNVRLQHLEQFHTERSDELRSSSAVRIEAEHELTVDGEDILNIEQRLARLEKVEQDRREKELRRAEQIELVQAQRRRAQAQMAEAAVRVMSDPTADDESKVQAWRGIRSNAAETWSDSIVAEAVRIGTTSSDPEVRADIWRQAHADRTHPLLLQPLLQALTTDQDRSVREEAAETLDLYLEQAGVRQALQTAAEYDADPGVQQQALISLNGPRGGF